MTMIFDPEQLISKRRKPRRLVADNIGWIEGEASTRIPSAPPRRLRAKPLQHHLRKTLPIGLKRAKYTAPKHRRAGITTRELLWEKETEAHFQARVVGVAKYVGFKYVYHTYDSRRSPSGFPDLVLLNPASRRLLFVELKSQRGKLTLAQTLWRVALEAIVGVEYYTWKPSQWNELVRVLGG